MTKAPATPQVSSGNPLRRPLLLGVAIGLLVPMLAFLGLSAGLMMADYWWLGSAVWSLVAFVGVALLFFDRTRRFGLGILLGFGCLLLTGAGACTVMFATS